LNIAEEKANGWIPVGWKSSKIENPGIKGLEKIFLPFL
jgi:hypothetical protein